MTTNWDTPQPQQHQSQNQQQDWSTHQYWCCKGCGFWNWHTNKACGRCKGQKQYMCQAVPQTPSPHQKTGGGGKAGKDGKNGGKDGGKANAQYHDQSHSTAGAQNSTHGSKMDQLTDLLQRATLGMQEDQGFQLKPTATGTPASGDVVVDKKALTAKISSLEAVLTTLPPDMDETRQHITDQIVKLKSELQSIGPIGIRIENCRGALVRGRTRL